MTGRSWERLDLHPPDHELYDQYWRWIRGDLDLGNVGDANSWPPHLLPAVNKVQPIDRVIYLTRNGVQQLHSLSTASPTLKRDPLPKVAEVKLKALWDIAWDLAEVYKQVLEWPEKPYGDWTRFEKLCLMIAANAFMPGHLHGQGLKIEAYNLEWLVNDIDTLAEHAPELDKKTLKEWQKTDINRKVKGGRAPVTLWRNWSEEQREAYKAIVGEPYLKSGKPPTKLILAL
jgi:hypothetical protein